MSSFQKNILALPDSTGNDGKFLNLTGGNPTWDAVTNVVSGAFVANAASITLNDSSNYLFDLTGVLTAQGVLTPSVLNPLLPVLVAFDNQTTGGFPVVLAGTYTIPPARSLWYWNGAGGFELISFSGYRTPLYALPAIGSNQTIPHLMGSDNFSAKLEFVCQINDGSFVAGDVLQDMFAYVGYGYNISLRVGVANVVFGLLAASSYIYLGAGINQALSAASWKCRLIIR